jgi:hypothetical protein
MTLSFLHYICFNRLFGSLAVVLLAFLSTHSQNPLAHRDNQYRIINKTESFGVASIKNAGNEVILTLKNGYERRIIGFRIGLPRPLNGSGTAIDLCEESGAIEPGETSVCSFTLRVAERASDNTQEVIIYAVVFDDYTSDGDAKTAAILVAERLGEKTQVSRILPLLDDFLSLPDRSLLVGLEKLKSQVLGLSVSATNAPEAVETLKLKYGRVFAANKDQLLDSIGSGLYFEQGNFVVRIRDLESRVAPKGGVSLREELSALKMELSNKLLTL